MKRVTKTTTPKPKQNAPAFWLVWRDLRYNNVPNHRHATKDLARKEAERLAKENPGAKFYILPASEFAEATINPVTWSQDPAATAAMVDQEVPF